MIVGEKRCPICESKQTHEWEYTEDVKGDTTFETPYTSMVIQRARRMILETAQEAMKRNFTLCLSRPPGHHSCSDKKRKGFCHANFVIDALDYFHNRGLKVVIIDIDAHHGDGTEHDVLERNYGYYTSIHGFGPNVYPGTGNSCESERILNIPLEKDANTERWLSVWREKCIPFVMSKMPDILLLSCGLDAHEEDVLAPLKLTTSCFTEISKDLKTFQVPIFAVLEGGYCLPVLGDCVCEILSAFT